MEYTFTAEQLAKTVKKDISGLNEELRLVAGEAALHGLIKSCNEGKGAEWTEAGIAWYEGQVAEDLGHKYKQDYFDVVVDLEQGRFFMVKNAGSQAHVFNELKKREGYYAKRFKVFGNGIFNTPQLDLIPKKYHRNVCFDRRAQ